VRVYLNGKFTKEKSARISITDHGFLYGDGVYETIRVRRGEAFLFKEHIVRLKRSAAALALRLPVTAARLTSVVKKLIGRDRDAVVRITLTRGPGPYGFDPRPCRTPTLLITCASFKGYAPAGYKKGVRAAIVSVRRNSAAALPPSIKSTSCLNSVLAKIESIRMKCDEGLFLSEDGFVSEGTVSNIFYVKKGAVITPALDGHLLPGVTRRFVLELARRSGLKTIEKKVSPRELASADEIFLTNSLMDILPVGVLVEGKRTVFRKGVGPVTKELMARWAARYR
jgi:branched-chain amino acid aminotransferase